MDSDQPPLFLIVVDDHRGHVHALLGVARRLAARGHGIVFAGPGQLAAVVESNGFPYRAEPWLAPADPASAFPAKGAVARAQARRITRMACTARATMVCEATARLYGELRPDLVIFDPFLLGHYPAFWRMGARCVAVSTKPLLTPDRSVPPYTSGVVPRGGAADSVGIAASWMRQWVAYVGYRLTCLGAEALAGSSHRALTLAVARASAFPIGEAWWTRPVPFDLRYRTVPEVVLHAREFEFPRARRLEGPGAYAGPCVDTNRSEGPWTPPSGSGPLIYCHLGSVRRQHTDDVLRDYTAVVAAASLEPEWRLVVATGSRDLADRLRTRCPDPRRGRLQITDWSAQATILAHAHAVVTHAGSNSVKEAIASGVPMVCLPRTADQPGVAARVQYHGLGLRVPGAYGYGPIRDALRAVLASPSFGRQVGAMRAAFRRYDADRICERILVGAARGIVPRFDNVIGAEPRAAFSLS